MPGEIILIFGVQYSRARYSRKEHWIRVAGTVGFRAMIRRQVGQEYWLIGQDDHAQISGRLAEQLGNARFSPPSCASAVLGIALHDCGWPIHDEHPTLNPRHQPLDIFESPMHIGLRIWDASAERAAARDDYAGLLVSLHGLALSLFATGPSPRDGEKWDLGEPRARFEVNRFQHKMIELQESLRQRLGMSSDGPLKHGLAESSSDPREQKLVFDFRWLQMMDQLSLCICCTEPPFQKIGPMLPRPGAAPAVIGVCRPTAEVLTLSPWPFGPEEVRIEVPYRRVPARRFEDDADLGSVYTQASVERFTVALRPHTI